MRKPRSDSPLRALSPEIQAQVAELCAQHGFGGAVAKVRALTGLAKGVSASSLQRWHAWWRVETAISRQRDEALAFEELLLDRPDLDLDAERARRVAQIVFERQVLESQDPKLYLAWRKQQLDQDKFELVRRQAEAAAKAVSDPSLADDPAAQVRRVREIFGLGGAA